MDVVFDCSGKFNTSEYARAHQADGKQRIVIMSKPPNDGTPMFIMGVNHDQWRAHDTIVSMASCTVRLEYQER